MDSTTLHFLTLLVAGCYVVGIAASPAYLGRMAGVSGLGFWTYGNVFVIIASVISLLDSFSPLPVDEWTPLLILMFIESIRRMLGLQPLAMRWFVALFGVCLALWLLTRWHATWGGVLTNLLMLGVGASSAFVAWRQVQHIGKPICWLLTIFGLVPALMMAIRSPSLASWNLPIGWLADNYLLVNLILLVNINISIMFLGLTLLARRLRAMNTMDPMVGIPNRFGLLIESERLLRTATLDQQPLAILMIDMDHFSRVNELAPYFHEGGDAVLRAAAQRIHDAVCGVNGVVGRYGGEEFLAIITVADSQEALRCAEQVRQAVAASPVVHRELSIPVTCSIGVCFSGQRHPRLSVLIGLADQVLYQAKSSGRNRSCLSTYES